MDNKIWFSSDLHLGHNRSFIYEPRGFTSVDEHDETIINNWNSIIEEEDEVYILGDLMLNDNEKGIQNLLRLNGKKHIVLGNHDTDTRVALYREHITTDIKHANKINYKGYHFYLSHFPTITSNIEKESLKQCTCNLHGHTHDKRKFYKDIPFIYNVALDAHNNFPVLLDDIIEDMENEVKICKSML